MIKSSEFLKSAPSLEHLLKKEKKIELSPEDEKWVDENMRLNLFSLNPVLYSLLVQLRILDKARSKTPTEMMRGSGWRGSDRKSAEKLHQQARDIAVLHVPGFQQKGFGIRKLLEKINNIPHDLEERVKDTANLARELREQGIKEAGTIVLHLGDIVNSEYGKNPKDFFTFLQDKIARPYNIKIALENIPKDSAEKICKNRSLYINEYIWTYDPRETIKLLQKYGIDLNLVGLCLDTAHLGISFEEEISEGEFSLAQLLKEVQILINSHNKNSQNLIKLGSILHNVHLVNVDKVDKEEKKERDDTLPLADKNGVFSLKDFGEFLHILQADEYSSGLTLEVSPEPMHNKVGKIGLLIGALGSYLKQFVGLKQNDPYVAAGVTYLNECANQVRQAMATCSRPVSEEEYS